MPAKATSGRGLPMTSAFRSSLTLPASLPGDYDWVLRLQPVK